MITFWSGHYTKKQIAAMHSAIECARQFILVTADCQEYSQCSECEYKEPCDDLRKLRAHISDLAG